MDEQLLAHYHRHVAMAFDRQQRLTDFLARKAPGQKPSYDVATAALSFGKLKFEAPLLGLHAVHNNSWMWAWSSKNLKLTITNRAVGDTVRMLLHRLGLHGLAAPGFSLEPMIGADLLPHATAVIGSVLGRELEYDAYYSVPFEGGRATVLIRDRRLHFTERKPLRRILTILPEVIRKLPVFDHKGALASHAADYRVTVADGQTGLTLSDGNDELTASFDDRGRLTGFSGSVSPEERKPAKKKTTPREKPAGKKPVKAGGRKTATASPPKKSAKNPSRKPTRKR